MPSTSRKERICARLLVFHAANFFVSIFSVYVSGELLFEFPEMDAGGFFEVVAGVEDFVAVPEGDVAGDFAVADGVEEEHSAFAGDIGFLFDEFGFAPALGDDVGEAGGAGGEFAIDADGFPAVAG